MEGDITAPVGPLKVRSHLVGRKQQVVKGGPDSEGVDGMVLEEKQVVLRVVGRPSGSVDPLLEGQGVAIANAAQPPDPKRSGVEVGGHGAITT